MRVFIERHSQALELAGLSHCTKTTYEDEPNDNYPKVTFTGEATGPDFLLDAVQRCRDRNASEQLLRRWQALTAELQILLGIPIHKG